MLPLGDVAQTPPPPPPAPFPGFSVWDSPSSSAVLSVWESPSSSLVTGRVMTGSRPSVDAAFDSVVISNAAVVATSGVLVTPSVVMISSQGV